MNNKIDDALKTLPDGLTWGQAMDLVGQSVLKPLLWVSGKISCNDEMTDADRYRLADIISKQTSPKEGNNTMTDEAPNPLLDADQRQYLRRRPNTEAVSPRATRRICFRLPDDCVRKSRPLVLLTRRNLPPMPHPSTRVPIAQVGATAHSGGTIGASGGQQKSSIQKVVSKQPMSQHPKKRMILRKAYPMREMLICNMWEMRINKESSIRGGGVSAAHPQW